MRFQQQSLGQDQRKNSGSTIFQVEHSFGMNTISKLIECPVCGLIRVDSQHPNRGDGARPAEKLFVKSIFKWGILVRQLTTIYILVAWAEETSRFFCALCPDSCFFRAFDLGQRTWNLTGLSPKWDCSLKSAVSLSTGAT